jgi:predicted DNA-binding transcriptional regulator YafY
MRAVSVRIEHVFGFVMYHPTTRVLAVLELLQSRQRVSGRELAERLEVDARTVRRYVTMLQDLGIPVEAERGRYGAYRLRPGFKLPPLMFSDDEALAVVLGLLAARRLGLAVAALAAEGALAKIERVLPAALRTQVQAVEQALTLDLPAFDSRPVGEVVILLGTAAQQRRQVWLRYRSRALDEETERVVNPYGIVYREGRWYAVGYCHLRNDLRVFRLDRVLEARPRDETFVRPSDFDTLGHLLRAMALVPSAWEVEVLLRTTLPEARRDVSPTLASLEPTNDGVVLRCSVEDLEWMARFLAGLPWPFAIRRPDELRLALRRHAEALLAAEANGGAQTAS